VTAQKRLAVLRVAKRFRPARPRYRKRSNNVAEFQAILDFSTANKLVNEPGVEAIARAHMVDYIDYRWESRKFFFGDPRLQEKKSIVPAQRGRNKKSLMAKQGNRDR
jgi:hypothetical protein